MKDNPTLACRTCKVPVELGALKQGGFCPTCAPAATDSTGWEVDHDYDAGCVTYLTEYRPEIEGCDIYCEVMVDDLNTTEVATAPLTWSVSLGLDMQGVGPDVASAKKDALMQAAEKLMSLIAYLKETYEREQ